MTPQQAKKLLDFGQPNWHKDVLEVTADRVIDTLELGLEMMNFQDLIRYLHEKYSGLCVGTVSGSRKVLLSALWLKGLVGE